MPPEPARPHRMNIYEQDALWTEARRLAAENAALRAALERCIPLLLDEWEGCSADSEGLQAVVQARAALNAATAPAAPGEQS